MLSRLASSAKTHFKVPSNKSGLNTNVSRTAGKAHKAPRTLATSFASSRATSITSALKLATSTRCYASKGAIVEAQLADALKENAINATTQFDSALLESLLERNGWELLIVENRVELSQSFADSNVVVEILTESNPSNADAMASMNPDHEHNHEHHEHEHDHDHHHHDEANTNIFKGQNDTFNVIVSKNNKSEQMVFGCSCREGVLEIESVTFTKPGTPYKYDFMNPITPGSLTQHTLSFAELAPEVQDAFETYLQEHGLNHDLATIIYYSLYKYDLHYEQSWSYAGQAFLSN